MDYAKHKFFVQEALSPEADKWKHEVSRTLLLQVVIGTILSDNIIFALFWFMAMAVFWYGLGRFFVWDRYRYVLNAYGDDEAAKKFYKKQALMFSIRVLVPSTVIFLLLNIPSYWNSDWYTDLFANGKFLFWVAFVGCADYLSESLDKFLEETL